MELANKTGIMPPQTPQVNRQHHGRAGGAVARAAGMAAGNRTGGNAARRIMVELCGIEPQTSCVQSRRSPS